MLGLKERMERRVIAEGVQVQHDHWPLTDDQVLGA